MKRIVIFLLLLAGCGQNKNDKTFDTSKQDVQLIEKEVADFLLTLKKAYNHQGVNTDSLMDAYFDPTTYYVTYWGTSEPIDTTKKRLRDAVPHVSDYDNQFESFRAKAWGDGAYAFFILRQTYKVDGKPLDEYLPTTFVFERRGDRWIVIHAQRTSDYETMRQLVALAQSRMGNQSTDSKR
jgi:hypothetical protein